MLWGKEPPGRGKRPAARWLGGPRRCGGGEEKIAPECKLPSTWNLHRNANFCKRGKCDTRPGGAHTGWARFSGGSGMAGNALMAMRVVLLMPLVLLSGAKAETGPIPYGGSDRFYGEAPCQTQEAFLKYAVKRMVDVYLIAESVGERSGFPLTEEDFEGSSVLELMFNERGSIKGTRTETLVGLRYTYSNYGFYVIRLADKGVCIDFLPTLITLDPQSRRSRGGISFKPPQRKSEEFVRRALERTIGELGDVRDAARRPKN